MPDAPTVPADASFGWRLEDTYSRLPAVFYERTAPERFPAPKVAVWNRALAARLGLALEGLDESARAEVFAGRVLPAGAAPIAQAYAGHQYGHFTMLGDGRAVLLGEQRAPDGALFDLQYKGAGRTRYSRRGDGRAVLGPMLREYVISEAMAALGVPTTRSLAVAETGETVWRDEAKRGAVLLRVAASHLRVGTFQYAVALRDDALVRALADYAVNRHDPELVARPDRYLAFLRAVVARQARLVARWLAVGFVHGVMNTDNTTVSGETIDYGPCAFLDAYDPDAVFSSIDQGGRYRFSRQPTIMQWNLARFAEALLPLLDADGDRAVALGTEVVEEFTGLFREAWLGEMRRKLGLANAEDADAELVRELLEIMHDAGADYTNTFRELPRDPAPTNHPAGDRRMTAWRERWLARLDRSPRARAEAFAAMDGVNPAVIPRNHRVEEALAAAERDGDLAPLHALLRVLATPYTLSDADRHFSEPAPPSLGEYRTFCGT